MINNNKNIVVFNWTTTVCLLALNCYQRQPKVRIFILLTLSEEIKEKCGHLVYCHLSFDTLYNYGYELVKAKRFLHAFKQLWRQVIAGIPGGVKVMCDYYCNKARLKEACRQMKFLPSSFLARWSFQGTEEWQNLSLARQSLLKIISYPFHFYWPQI